MNRDKLKEGKFDEAVSVDSTFKSKDLPMSDLYDLQRGIEQMLPMEVLSTFYLHYVCMYL